MKFSISKKIFNDDDYFVYLPNNKEIVPIKIKFDTNLKDILFVEKQKNLILENTKKFKSNIKSNNILLWGASGMGKSTLVKCVIKETNKFAKKSLKLIEISNNHLELLPEIIYSLSQIDYKFIIFIDDIFLKKDNPDFNTLKSIVEGSLLGDSDNIRFYITSNLRHISDQNTGNSSNDELIKKELRSNLLSLTDRFALWIGFYDNNKDKYLETVKYYAKKLKKNSFTSKKALEWSINKGNYSGRTALQYIKNLDD